MQIQNDENEIREAYVRMYAGMIAKDGDVLRDVLDERFVLHHMTGMRQSRDEFIASVLDGTLNYYSVEHERMSVVVDGDTAVLTGQSYVSAVVFGGNRHHWHLQQKCTLKKTADGWKITQSIASTY